MIRLLPVANTWGRVSTDVKYGSRYDWNAALVQIGGPVNNGIYDMRDGLRALTYAKNRKHQRISLRPGRIEGIR